MPAACLRQHSCQVVIHTEVQDGCSDAVAAAEAKLDYNCINYMFLKVTIYIQVRSRCKNAAYTICLHYIHQFKALQNLFYSSLSVSDGRVVALLESLMLAFPLFFL